MKILITGGHFTPAMALIQELRKQKKTSDVTIFFVGRKYLSDSDKAYTLEYQETNKQHIRFIPLEAGRITRLLSLQSLKHMLRIPFGFIQAFSIVRSTQPDIVMSFGGYIALPVVFSSFVFHIPVYTHEQTIHPGLANRLIGLMAKKIFLAFSEAQPFFDMQKTVVVGNPVRANIAQVVEKPFEVPAGKPVLYVTGGSLGSHSINQHLFRLLKRLLRYCIVIHQVGDTKEYKDYEKSVSLKNTLPKKLSQYYFPRKHFYENEIGYVYKKTNLVIGRSGANTFFELVCLKKPALFIPLPWAANNEQEKHAAIFVKYHTGEMFNQADSSDLLFEKIKNMINNLDAYKKEFASLSHLYKYDATQYICKEILASV